MQLSLWQGSRYIELILSFFDILYLKNCEVHQVIFEKMNRKRTSEQKKMTRMNEMRYTIIEKFTTDRLIGKKNQES